MSTINEIVAGYIAAWNESDAGRRRDIIARTLSDDGSYLDAHRDGIGHTAIDAMIGTVQARFPGYRFRLSSGIEVHHDRLRFELRIVRRGATRRRLDRRRRHLDCHSVKLLRGRQWRRLPDHQRSHHQKENQVEQKRTKKVAGAHEPFMPLLL